MTKNMQTAPIVGQTVHFLGTVSISRSVSMMAPAFATRYGMELVVEQGMYDASLDRHGHSWFDLAGDPDAQIARWGKVIIELGPWPEDELRVAHGSPEWKIAREIAMKEATSLTDPAAVAAARRAVEAKYGRGEFTSHTLMTYPEGRQ